MNEYYPFYIKDSYENNKKCIKCDSIIHNIKKN